MSSSPLGSFRRTLVNLPLGGVVLLPVLPLALGALALAQSGGSSPGSLGIGLLLLGSAIALARVATALVDQRLAHLKQLHQQTEEALRQSEANLLQTQQIAQLGSWELDLVTQNITWSEEMFRIFGLDSTQAQPSYDQVMATVPEGDRERLAAAIDQAIADGSPYEVEHRICRPDGTVRYLLSRGQAKTNDSQHIIKLLGTALDITDRKQAELALQASETRFQEMAQTLNQVSYVLSLPSGEYLYISPAYERLWGYSCESLYQDHTSWLNRVHPDDLDHVLATMTQLLAGQQKRVEFRILTANGDVRWVESESLIVKDENGNPLRVVGLADDITHRKQVEARLRDQEAKLRAIGDNLPKGFIYQLVHAPDRGFYYSYISAGIERVTGFKPEAIIQNPNLLQDSLIEEDRLICDQLMQQSLEALSIFETQMRVRNVAEKMQWLTTVAVPRHLEDGSTVWDGVTVDITDLKQAELALQESETRFQEIVQTVNQVPYVVSIPSGEYLYISPAYERLWGYSCESLYQDQNSWLNRVHPDDLDYVSAALTQVVSGQPRRIEFRLLTANGDVRWLESESLIVNDETGNPLRVVGMVEDITHRKQVEATLRDQEAKLRAIGDNLPKGFIYQVAHNPDRGFYYSYISAGIEQITGFTPEAVIQNPGLLWDSLIEEDRLISDQLMQQSLEALSLFETQIRVRNQDGKMQWLTTVAVPRRLEDGSTVWDGVVVDITSLKQAETALRNSEELFRSAFDDAPIGIALISPTGRFLKANHYLCNLLGYSQAELLELCFQDITHPGDLNQNLQGLTQMLEGELSNLEMKKRYISQQGTAIPVLINASFVNDTDGTPLYYIEHVQDIREQLKVERMKDEFVSIVSHELRTPITSINGSLALLDSGIYDAQPEKAKNMLRVAIRNSDRLVRLVDDILSFERLESGKVQLEKEHCQVATLLHQAIDSVQPLADQSGITIALAPLTTTLWAAPDGIIQVLTNLLSNAVKFSSQGGTIWVNASTERLEAEASTPSVLFTVQDHGRGIPKDKLETIFDQFQQVDASDSRLRGGTGLGLSICKSIVEQHGGSIWVESVVAQGSTFFFTVPLERSEG